ncbi:hypothetical protein A1O1_01023 [Capronia coronata CBS 617.96]|uniref:Mediator of RNA polymerase II transcription subunit 10 n=1 Tax=Capronia coronata CBS 617.96 TaxID=1182541 RepID=W9YTR7_9EURO|nr:uncharacterized protein A1O1_01023 [Capronia coronata CBS 617.96]EXJ95898.1 hypothetical protein A1O1_01023 [Capronia coronata CBS 617.96]
MAPKLTLKMSRGVRGATSVSEPTNTNDHSILAPPDSDRTRAQRARSGAGEPIRTAAGDTGRTRTPELEEDVTEEHSRPASTFITLRIPPERLHQTDRSIPSTGSFITRKVSKRSRRAAVQNPSSPSGVSHPSPHSLLSDTASTFAGTEVDYAQETPATVESPPQLYPNDDYSQSGLTESDILQHRARSGPFNQIGLSHTTTTTDHRPATPTEVFDSGQIDPTIDPALYQLHAESQTMAPVKDTTNVHNTIKDIIQDLTEIQIQTHGYVPETQDLLVEKMTDLAESLSRLQNLTSATASPNSYIHQVQIAPEIVDYVDDGRNPDIFTRDFVENVQRGNAVINGKQQAFKDFSEIYAKALKEGIPGLGRQVDQVLENAGFEIDHKQEGEDEVVDHSNPNGPQMSDGV